ncbi:MAG: gliding motility-associated C-terminal domain-containing protein, partial [Flavobacteriales bacterium]|nr:gliding motility-associated C-terminal domain-containing protein [Flavobacteriales bacterium]
SGQYRVGLHWENNGIFQSDTSLAELWGADQFIRGDSVTRFWNLTLSGTGVKTQQINSFVKHILQLNDRELATDVYSMSVLHTDTGAIQRTTGFVSSLDTGKLYRLMDQPLDYRFPTGSSVGTPRYRPVLLRPSAPGLLAMGVRLANVDATTEGYDRTQVDSFVCQTQPEFYHRINRLLGTQDVRVRVYYDLNADGPWDGLAQWQSGGFWKDLSPTTYLQTAGEAWVQKTFQSSFDPQPFILSKVRPGVPTIVGPDTICGSYLGQYQALPDSSHWSYSWTVQNGLLTNPGSTASNNGVVWNGPGGLGQVSVVVTTPNGCSSFPGNLNVWVWPQVVAGFQFQPNGTFGSEPIVFVDTSLNAISWQWDFGDGHTSSLANPTHVYNHAGQYSVQLVATSPNGCLDTAYAQVQVIDGTLIPNIMTLNGDGLNDLFHVKLSGVKDYHCLIYNRWGNLMFESTSPQLKWDGSTLAGMRAVNGVYYVVIEVRFHSGHSLTYTGTLTIVD